MIAIYHAARHHRAIVVAAMLRAAITKAGAVTRRALARYRRHRQAVATYETLRELDNRVLHDLGFDRSELTSIAEEAAGKIERTRMRAMLGHRAEIGAA
jgi:uncharacterized protein YjiS (DUF1127 family)